MVTVDKRLTFWLYFTLILVKDSSGFTLVLMLSYHSSWKNFLLQIYQQQWDTKNN